MLRGRRTTMAELRVEGLAAGDFKLHAVAETVSGVDAVEGGVFRDEGIGGARHAILVDFFFLVCWHIAGVLVV